MDQRRRKNHYHIARVAYAQTWKYWALVTGSAFVGVAGAGCFVVFCLAYSNYAAGMWALSAAIFSFAALHLHMLNLFDRLSSWHDAQSFTQIKYLALGVCGLSTIGGAVFGALALRMKEEVDFDENNFFISSIAAGLSLLSGLMLLVTAIFYRKHIREASDQQFLTDDQQSPGPPYA